MNKIVILTDLHILSESHQRIIGLDPSQRLNQAVAHIRRYQADCDLVICTGDLTHRGEVAAYQRLREILQTLPCPYRLLPGNHDLRENLLQVFPEQARDEQGFMLSHIDTPHHRLLLLDTLRPTPGTFGHAHDGHLCRHRLDWLEDRITSSELPVLIFMHHPPHPTGFAAMDAIALANGEDFYTCVLRHPDKVRHLVCGHVHRTISGQHRGLSFSIFKSPCHQMPMEFHDQDASLSVDEPGAYGILLLTPLSVLAHTEDFALAGRNAPVRGYQPEGGQQLPEKTLSKSIT